MLVDNERKVYSTTTERSKPVSTNPQSELGRDVNKKILVLVYIYFT